MDPLTAKFKADTIRRHRFCVTLFQQSTEYKSWSDGMRHDYQERIGMIVGADPVVTAEAHIYAVQQVLRTDEP